jgi:hypothetical protein
MFMLKFSVLVFIMSSRWASSPTCAPIFLWLLVVFLSTSTICKHNDQ